MIRRIVLLLFFMSISQSQWQEINQPDIGAVSIILADGNQLFTATNQAQVYTSIDQADSWEMLADTMDTQPYVSDLLLIKGDAVFFTQNIGAGPYNYICLSGFAGWGPWQELAHQSSALISMVDNDSLIFTLLNGISISSDRGETWTEIPEPPITGYIRLNLATNDYLYVSHGCQIYRTADLGQTWEDITGILDDEGFASPYSCSAILAMASHEDQLIISMYWGGGVGPLVTTHLPNQIFFIGPDRTMKYIQNIKEYFFVVVIFYLALSITKNGRVIRELLVQVEQTNETLYQTNQVIAEMKKDNYGTSFSHAE